MSGSSLITEPEQWVEADLVVDRGDPFFFDHPLDHIPGTLQLFALFDTVRAAAGCRLGTERGTRLRLSVEFPSFCEFEGDIRLGCLEIPAASPDEAGSRRSWRVRAEQNGYVSCVGSIELIREAESASAAFPGPRTGAAGLARHGNVTRITGSRVHRVNPENIMIGDPVTGNGGRVEAPVLAPPTGHFLSRSGRSERGPELLIEAARQFTVFVEDLTAARGGESQMLLSSLFADFPCGIYDYPLSLRVMETVRAGSYASHKLGIFAARGTEVLGTFSISGRVVSKAAYSRMRNAA